MNAVTKFRQPSGSKVPSATHSVRTPDAAWAAAKRRATSEGVSVNYVVAQLLEGYGQELLNLPHIVKQYDKV